MRMKMFFFIMIPLIILLLKGMRYFLYMEAAHLIQSTNFYQEIQWAIYPQVQ